MGGPLPMRCHWPKPFLGLALAATSCSSTDSLCWMRCAEVRILGTPAVRFCSAIRQEGMRTPDGTLGVAVTGSLDEKLFRAMAELIPEGTWELVCHPGYNDDDLKAAGTRLRESR